MLELGTEACDFKRRCKEAQRATLFALRQDENGCSGHEGTEVETQHFHGVSFNRPYVYIY